MDTNHPMKYICTENTFSIGFRDRSDEVKSKISIKINAKTSDSTDANTNQKSSLNKNFFI